MVKLIWRLSDNWIYHVFSMKTPDNLFANFTINLHKKYHFPYWLHTNSILTISVNYLFIIYLLIILLKLTNLLNSQTVGFQKQNLEVHKNRNSENPRALRKNWFHWTKSILWLHSGLSQANSKFVNKSYRSLESLLLAVEGFEDLPNPPFSAEWVKRMNIPRKRLPITEFV